jgi:hypothetical protein
MHMPGLTQLVAWEIKGFLVALAAIVAGQLLGGQISTKNLLYGRKNDAGQPVYNPDGTLHSRKTEDTPYFSPERVQLLLMTLAAASYYLTQVFNNPILGTLPDVPSSWTTTLGASNALYLGGKALARFWPRDRDAHGNPT